MDENLQDLRCKPGRFLFRYAFLARAVSFLRKYCNKGRGEVEVFVIVHLVKSEKSLRKLKNIYAIKVG